MIGDPLLIPVVNGNRRIDEVVLSPAINPFGATDPAGIYWINAGGQALRLSHVRLNRHHWVVLTVYRCDSFEVVFAASPRPKANGR